MYSHHSVPYARRPNRINASVAYQMMGARPGTKLSEAKCPVLVVMAEADDIIAAKVTREVAAKAQSSQCCLSFVVADEFADTAYRAEVELVAVPGGHFDLMEGGPVSYFVSGVSLRG
jgi:dienelactone hydrolase